MRKIVLLIFEGDSDSFALYDWLYKIGNAFDVQFEVLDGDPFSNYDNQGKSSKNIVGAIVAKFKKDRKIRDEDILAVFQLTDTDGVFIPAGNIIFDRTSVEQKKYMTDKIVTKNERSQKLIAQRNEHKRNHLIALTRTKMIRKAVYEIYYFSRNLDAIIHNSADISYSDKITAAEAFSDSFASETEFEQFFNNKEFAVAGDYKETWDFITQGCNSLNRYSNFHLLFASLRVLLEEHRRESQ